MAEKERMRCSESSNCQCSNLRVLCLAMICLPFVLFCLAQLVQGTSADSTSSSCPPLDGDSRDAWSILESCVLTLLICVWHAIHLDIPGSGDEEKLFYERVPWIFITTFFAPEAVVSIASKKWCEAHAKVKEFRVQGYEWSMSHSYFAEMGGFVFDEGKESPRTITSYEFLRLCEKGRIANPLLTAKQIKAFSKSDTLGKAVFALQLFWFMLQVVVRGLMDLAITLVELDTVCMAVLALIYIFFWWDKPHQPKCPHIFYQTQEAKIYSKEKLSKAWKAEKPNYLWDCIFKARLIPDEKILLSVEDKADLRKPGKMITIIEEMNPVDVQLRSLYLTWITLGGLHLIAWNWAFPTETEKIAWRVASLVLACCPLAMAIVRWFEDSLGSLSDTLTYGLGTSGITARVLLVGLMLASVRALPCSAYESVTWTNYIPHL